MAQPGMIERHFFHPQHPGKTVTLRFPAGYSNLTYFEIVGEGVERVPCNTPAEARARASEREADAMRRGWRPKTAYAESAPRMPTVSSSPMWRMSDLEFNHIALLTHVDVGDISLEQPRRTELHCELRQYVSTIGDGDRVLIEQEGTLRYLAIVTKFDVEFRMDGGEPRCQMHAAVIDRSIPSNGCEPWDLGLIRNMFVIGRYASVTEFTAMWSLLTLLVPVASQRQTLVGTIVEARKARRPAAAAVPIVGQPAASLRSRPATQQPAAASSPEQFTRKQRRIILPE